MINGDLSDPAALRALADAVDLITYEFESSPVAPLQADSLEQLVLPPLSALA